MDNHFVPNLTLGLPVVQALLAATDLPLDCHLMIEDPDRWAVGYAEAGAHNVTVHVEAAADPVGLAKDLRAAGALAGLSIKPGTPLEPHVETLRHYDTLLVMSVEPGFGGQGFIPEVLRQGPRARAGWSTPGTCGCSSRSTAASTPTRSRPPPRPGSTASWPVPRSTARTTRRAAVAALRDRVREVTPHRWAP